MKQDNGGCASGNSWRDFFDAHAPQYMSNVFTRNTAREVDFLIEELALAPGGSVLDVACGTGRHSIELARRGYRPTGLDFSPGMLRQAREAAIAANVVVQWVEADAMRFAFPQEFDAVICLCEGAFGLLSAAQEAIEQPLAILRNVARCLKVGGKALFTVLNGCRMIRDQKQADVESGCFDPLTLSRVSEHAPAPGLPPVAVRERAFVPTELALLFRMAGMEVLSMWGGTAGNWNRAPIQLDEIEIMVVGRKVQPAREPPAPDDSHSPR